jgi:hypothetical protein
MGLIKRFAGDQRRKVLTSPHANCAIFSAGDNVTVWKEG